jgi:hypothetical protein
MAPVSVLTPSRQQSVPTMEWEKEADLLQDWIIRPDSQINCEEYWKR